MTVTRIAASIAIAALALGVARAETLDELYEKAKAEQSVVFYSGGPAAPHENRAKAFMQRFPGITVSVTGGNNPTTGDFINNVGGMHVGTWYRKL